MCKYKNHTTLHSVIKKQLLLLSVMLCLVVSSSFANKGDSVAPAIQAIASKTGKTIDDFVIVGNKKLNLRHLSEQVTEYRILDKTTNRIIGVTLDGNAKSVDRYMILENNKKTKRNKFGGLTSVLADKVSHMKGQDKLVISAWVDGFDYPPFPRVNDKGLALGKKAYTDWEEKRKAALADHLIPIRNRFAAAGILGVQFSTDLPMIGAKLSKGQIVAISKFPGISISENIKLSLQSLAQVLTMKMGNYQNDPPFEGPYDSGYTGQNSTIALIEFSEIAFSTHVTASGQQIFNGYNRSSNDASCLNPDSNSGAPLKHITQVASVATGNTVTGYAGLQGLAYQAKVLGAHLCSNDNGSPASIAHSRAIAWAINSPQNANVVSASLGNDSMGQLDQLARVYDSFSRDNAKNIVVAASNCNASSRYVGTPGLAYNVITVGNSNHLDTHDWVGTNSWSDDIMRGSSCWKNPISLHGDREKPDVVAPGSWIDVWEGSGYPNTLVGENNVSGTSYSAPAVAGVVALAIEANPILGNWPELTKAIIAATAWQNIEGPPEATTDTSLDDRDGAGSVVGARVITVALDSSKYANGSIATTANGNITPPISIVAPTPGHLIRVALSWSVDTSYANYDNEPSADLDIRVVKPDGSFMPYEYTWDSTLEVIEFAAPVAGTYTFEIVQFRVASSTFYGIAVDSMDPAAIPSPRLLAAPNLPLGNPCCSTDN